MKSPCSGAHFDDEFTIIGVASCIIVPAPTYRIILECIPNDPVYIISGDGLAPCH